MKVVVYAICKNEAQFVDRWMDSMGEADEVVVLDTGSTDATAERLRARGARVTVEEIRPWRFDEARNRSLSLVPEDADLCVCTDLDEVFHPGWRAAMEAAWTPELCQLRYRYTWSFQEDGREGHVFWIEKAHSRRGWKWVNPVHEVLAWQGPGPLRSAPAPGVQLDHHPDPSKSRGQYLPLLELAVAEDPSNDRNMHYLGREYFFYRRWEECVIVLKKHLTLPTATWPDERCASMRYIARALTELERDGEAEQWHIRAVGEAPWLREPWLDYAMYLYRRQDWPGVRFTSDRALAIRERPQTYITEGESWGSLPYDLASLGRYYTGDLPGALEMAHEACALAPKDARLRANLALIERELGVRSGRIHETPPQRV